MSRRLSAAAIFSAVIASAVRQALGQQVVVSQIAAMPYIPVNYQYQNWTAVAQGFDSTVFNPTAQSGYQYPTFWFQNDRENGISQGFGMPSYIGQTQATEGNGEAITTDRRRAWREPCWDQQAITNAEQRKYLRFCPNGQPLL